MKETGFHIQAIYFDDDLLELRVWGSSGRFAGEADIYVGLEDIPNMAKALHGFPSKNDDNIEFKLGNFNPNNAGGGVHLIFQSSVTGKVAVEAIIQHDPRLWNGHLGNVQFTVLVEPAAIDNFVSMLEKLGSIKRGAAILCGLTTG